MKFVAWLGIQVSGAYIIVALTPASGHLTRETFHDRVQYRRSPVPQLGTGHSHRDATAGQGRRRDATADRSLTRFAKGDSFVAEGDVRNF